jgi:MFS family permease
LGAGIFLMGLSTNGIELLAAAALIRYGLGAIQPTGLALSTQYLGRSRYTVANATFYMMTDLACGISPITFGFVVPVLGYRGLFCSLLALSAAGIAGYIVLHRAHRV